MEEKTKIKLCGMRRPEDIRAVNQAKPDYIGFICSRRFWRHISLEEARCWIPAFRRLEFLWMNPMRK